MDAFAEDVEAVNSDRDNLSATKVVAAEVNLPRSQAVMNLHDQLSVKDDGDENGQ